ncbi:hypothetical protein GUA87_06365 [Sneathiella sp. P13V-1]|uniref:NAD(P)-binding domain-containing protein n=1 Tax=Sneathiella sp. P13V-1 TaxID=2697366 RepID=UPI00187B4099|nr:NAD(P)-binding domain-containing protein [Sneathiella sp. P13V-1]MBE7636463.1 hypothetical protein [Sneathiella sp. P13V-1]
MGNLSGTTIGVVGIGGMGRPIIRRFLDHKVQIFAYHIRPAIRYEIARMGISLTASLSDLAAKMSGQPVFLFLDPTEMPEVMEGDDGLLKNLAAETLIVDMSTTSVTDTKHYAKLARARGGDWIDIPARGNDEEAIEGKLKLSAGGNQKNLSTVKPLLDLVSKDIKLEGDIGSGQSAALAPS